MAMSWKTLSEAKKRMIRRAGLALVVYEAVFAATMYWVFKSHLAGRVVLSVALLPTAAVAVFMMVLARYLQEERDEFHRELVIRCLLWGLAAVMLVMSFHGFLQLFGWKGSWPVFIDLAAFVLAMGAAKLTYRVAHRVPADA